MKLIVTALFVVLTLFGAASANAQGLAGMEAKVLDLTKGSWVYFREYNGRQLIYFTHLEVYRCGIEKVRYSLDSDALDSEWKLQPCDPKKPNQITTDQPYVSLPPGTAQSATIQLTFKDGSKSATVKINSDNQLVR